MGVTGQGGMGLETEWGCRYVEKLGGSSSTDIRFIFLGPLGLVPGNCWIHHKKSGPIIAAEAYHKMFPS